MQIGIGTYSFGGIESYLGMGPTLLEKFKTAKALGFDYVELLPADLDNDVEDIKKWLDEAGLYVTSIHAEPSEEIVKKMAALGGQAVIWAGTNFNCREEAIEVAKKLDAWAEMAEPYGIKIGYHNHEKEFYFDEGKTLEEHLLDNSSKCYIQLDCGWAQLGGMYPPTFIRKYKNRVCAIHVKENNLVKGPGPQPESAKVERPKGGPFGDVKNMPMEKKLEILEGFKARQAAGDPRTAPQCKMGDPSSNMNWQEIKNALDEQDFDAFWIVERENFYTEHDQCLAEDAAYVKNNVK
ncbi:MAG: sugar phosphate isomerase/epimerase [Clostridia bacterium]|nr:sugar phosphate isomerase/epimerase [Clostridia bacterium]